MGFAIALSATGPTRHRVERLWDALAPGLVMAGRGHPPHLTCGIWRKAPAAEAGIQAARAVFAGEAAFSVRFARIAGFPGNPSVLSAAPEPTPRLEARHAALHRTPPSAASDAYCRAGTWIPHCRLAMERPSARQAEAEAWIGPLREPIDMVFDAADCVSLPSLAVLHREPLAPAP